VNLFSSVQKVFFGADKKK